MLRTVKAIVEVDGTVRLLDTAKATAATLFATFLILSMSATDVPPNFITIRAISA